jgi:hypothetical protein
MRPGTTRITVPECAFNLAANRCPNGGFRERQRRTQEFIVTAINWYLGQDPIYPSDQPYTRKPNPNKPKTLRVEIPKAVHDRTRYSGLKRIEAINSSQFWAAAITNYVNYLEKERVS